MVSNQTYNYKIRITNHKNFLHNMCPATVTFHIPGFLVLDSGGVRENGAAAPLRHVWDAHARREDPQAPPDGKMRPEYVGEVAKTGCGDSGRVNRGNIQPHR